MNYSPRPKKQNLPIDKPSKIRIYSRNKHKPAIEQYIRRAFSPNPFKSTDDLNKKIKLLPILVKEKTMPSNLPFSPSSNLSARCSIKLPEITGDGKFKCSEYFLPELKSDENFRFFNSEKKSKIFAKSRKNDFLEKATANFGSFFMKDGESSDDEISYREI